MASETWELKCSGTVHRVTWDDAGVTALDHDSEAENALETFGADLPLCLQVVRLWSSPDVDLIALIGDVLSNPRRRGILAHVAALSSIPNVRSRLDTPLLHLPIEVRHRLVADRLSGTDLELLAGPILRMEKPLDLQTLKTLSAGVASLQSGVGDDPDAAVLVRFFVDSRLVEIPSKASHRTVVLGRLVREFDPEATYNEKQVNEILTAFHPDYAALRRYLVDEKFMSRESGVYRRTTQADLTPAV